jgi:hypothetical protein
VDPESKELLEKVLRISEENNKILRSIRRSARVARILTILYWLVALGSAAAAYYFIEPYVQSLTGAYQSISDISLP